MGLIATVMVFLFSTVFLFPQEEVDEEFSEDVGYLPDWDASYPTPVPLSVDFVASSPGGTSLTFRDGFTIHLPEDVYHYQTTTDCQNGCPPLPVYTLIRGPFTVSIDGNREILPQDLESDNSEAFMFLIVGKEASNE